ncbi:MAG TPA: PstS family phosphate ABC transporter substrate-binding protein [Longimicrobiales bacterium]|nr:PstS family phosphate ABC transporter substrate-binding protein [Longimicrobiales bacterium]
MTMLRTTWTLAALLGLAACGGGDAGGGGELSGSIETDGSSTVYPITEAVAEEFAAAQPGVRVTVAYSGTGGGFKRFCSGETAISNASRPIKDSEAELCQQNNVEYLELGVATDGLAVVVNPQNSAVTCLTVAELKKIWEPGSRVTNWSEVRAGLPNETFKLYGPGTNSGTFDYFTEVIVGEAGSSRADYTASEDDNVLVQGVEGDRNALGYFGYAYYIENAQRLKALAVDGGNGCVAPTPETVMGGTYAPLSRPLFIYVNRTALQRPEVAAFVRFYMENAATLVPEVGYVPLEAAAYQNNISQLGTSDAF